MKDQNNIPIPGVGDEEVVYFTRRHWASLLGTIFLIFFMAIVPFVFGLAFKFLGNSPSQYFSAAIIAPFIAVYYLIIITFAFVEWVNFYYSVFILTKDEIIDITQQGFFNRLITQISIVRVQDVSASVKGFLPTLFGFGDVIAESAGEKTQTYIIEKIPRPMEVADKIIEIHDFHIRHEKFSDNLGAFHEEPASEAPSPAPTPPAQGDINKDDLNEGGEVKF